MSKSQSKKRQRICSSKTKLDATSDDFEEESHQFRFPKRIKVETATSKKKKTTSKNALPTYELKNKSSDSDKLIDTKDFVIEIEEEVATYEKCDQSAQTLINPLNCNDKESSHLADTLYSKELFPSDDEHADFITLEKSICSQTERLCPTCKHIVESSAFSSHFTECLKKFSYNKGKKYEDKAQHEEAFPCPVCQKTLNITIQRSAHIKNCAQLHKLTPRQLILASRLQEKQIEERLSLGLPIQPATVSDVGKKGQTNKGVARTDKDPDLELAVALSYSLAEEEKGKREQEEDTLLSIGLPILIQEKRRTNQLVLPPPTAVIPQVKVGRRKKNAIQQKTALMTRTKEVREQIISEKVATILGTKPLLPETASSQQVESKGVLKHFQDKSCTLWNMTHSDYNCPVDDNYVPELQGFIVKHELVVGNLLKHYSQVPGRLNFTVSIEDLEDQDIDENEKQENLETTIVDNYCTQLALAELLGSQENLSELSLDESSMSTNKEFTPCDVENDSFHSGNKLHFSTKNVSFTSIDESSKNSVIRNSQQFTVMSDNLDATSSQSKVQSCDSKNVDLCSEFVNTSDSNVESLPSFVKSLQDETFKKCVKDITTNTSFISEYENNKQSHLQSKLVADWREVLTDGNWCDMEVLTNLGKIPCHSLVLLVRCPEIMKECNVKPNDSQKRLNLNFIEHETVRKFIVYLYTGSVNIKSKNEPSWMELFDLAIKFKCKELISYLESIYKDPSSSFEHNTENYFDGNVCEHNSILTNFIPNSGGKCSDTTVIDVSPSPPPDLNKPTPNISENVKISLRRNWVGFTTLDGTRIGGHASDSVGCTFSPDIFEESVTGGDFVDTPVLTPPKCIESEKKIKSPTEVEDFEDDGFDHHRSLRRRQLFTDGINSSYASKLDLVQISNKLTDKFDAPTIRHSSFDVNESSSVLSSSVNGVDGIIDLTMSSDDSLENMTSPADHNSEIGDQMSLDQTLPFDPCSAVREENETSKIYSNNALKDTLNNKPCDIHPTIDLNITASKSNPIKEIIDITQDNVDSCSNNFSNYDEQKCNYSKYSQHSFDKDTDKSDFKLLSDKGKEFPDEERQKASPIIELATSPVKNNSYVSNVWDNFEDEGDFYFEYPEKDFTPLKRVNPSLLKENDVTLMQQRIVSPLKPTEVSPLKQIKIVQSKNSNNFTDNFRLPFKCGLQEKNTIDAHDKVCSVKDDGYNKEKSDSFCNVGNDTLLIAVAEVETQIDTSGMETVKENFPPKAKLTKLYKSKSCSLDNTWLQPSSSPVKTPISVKKWEPFNITPMPEYKTMVTPELKKELDRYGIRKLSRKRAITLLTHIYDQLHPVVSDSEVDTSYFETSDKGEQISRHISKAKGHISPNMKKRCAIPKNLKKCQSTTEELNTSKSSITSNEASDDECLEETAFLSDNGEDEEEISLTQQGSFESRMKDLIKLDVSLHEKILLYEPIWANELHAAAKANGIKCSMPALIDFLDSQCITFRLPTTRNRRRKCKKSPTKKSKLKAATQNN